MIRPDTVDVRAARGGSPASRTERTMPECEDTARSPPREWARSDVFTFKVLETQDSSARGDTVRECAGTAGVGEIRAPQATHVTQTPVQRPTTRIRQQYQEMFRTRGQSTV